MLDTLIAFSTMDGGYSYQPDPVTTTSSVILTIIMLVGMWATFTKAGRHGWAAIVPIYNIYTLLKVAGRPGWWTILFFIPVVNIVIHIIVSLDVAKRFGKGGAFGFFLLFLLSFIGYPMLGFGKAQYTAAPGV
jgi:hypothetical protein